MHRNALALTVLAGLAGTSIIALADPAAIRLTKDQIQAAEKAAQAKLPPVDKTQAAQCQKAVDAYNANASVTPLMTAAACYRSAGSLGAAITMWMQARQRYPRTPEAEDASRQLAPAYEAAGFFDRAADAADAYARAYPSEADARDLLVRATCTWEQLGADDNARRDLYELSKLWPHIKLDADHLCDAIRPIQPPAP